MECKRERSSDGGQCDVHELPLLWSTLASPLRLLLLSQGMYPGQFSEQCLVWRFLFRSWCSSHYVISTHDVCVCEYSHVGVRCFRLYALASCWKWRRNCGFVAWSWLGASHCCSHIIRLCTHAENMLGSYVLFLVQDFGKGLRFSVWNLLVERCTKRS
jgi:hypothetical protein